MAVKTYNKIVRDKIPEIIMKDGHTVTSRIITDNAEAQKILLDKLSEERIELINAINCIQPDKKKILDECIDVIDVVEAIVTTCGISFTEYWEAKQAKHNTKGEFKKNIFLIEVVEKEDSKS